MKKNTLALAVAAALGAGAYLPAGYAGGVTYKDGDKFVTIGGRMQVQYYKSDPDNGSSTDKVFFRRLRPYIEGSLYPNWVAKFQWDMGGATGDNEIAVKDAYIQYSGYKNAKISIGNVVFPFSREFVTSSKFQQFVEREFVGDSKYGTPEWNMGIHAKGSSATKKITWGAAFAEASIDPNTSRIDFDTPANKQSDFNQGWIVGGRVDFHPLGNLKFSQGDFDREQKATVGVAAYSWSNDDDNNVTPGADMDKVTGYEISGAYRNIGISIDAQYNRFDAELKDGTVTAGLFKNGETTLENWMIKGGYMVMPSTLELVAGYASQDADNYKEAWNRTTFGVNWYIHQHNLKYQLTYRMNENKDGTKGNDENELYLQAQFVF
ncbi:MAG TPA: hypothetical protein ENJ22_00220 [Gammaproteobacteria bacterium]|nr:hypothetical protein [Gammaproteobacteria bacterium]